MLVFDAAPQTRNEDVVDYPSLTVYTDTDAILLDDSDLHVAGDLAVLIAVQVLRLAMDQYGFGDDPNDPLRRYAIAQPPSDHESGMDIDDGAEVHEPLAHRDVGDVDRQNRVEAFGPKDPQKVGILVLRRI